MRSLIVLIIASLLLFGQLLGRPGTPTGEPMCADLVYLDLGRLVRLQARQTLVPPVCAYRPPRRRQRPPSPRVQCWSQSKTQLAQAPACWPVKFHTLVDNAQCAELVRRTRWPDGTQCVFCGSHSVKVLQTTALGWQQHQCLACSREQGRRVTFTDTTGTILEQSHLSPAQWVMALRDTTKGCSSRGLAADLDIAERSAMRLTRLIQVALYQQRPNTPLDGDTEIDEVYVIAGWKGCPKGIKPPRPPRRRGLKKPGRGTWNTDKLPILGVVRRKGQIRLVTCTHLRKDQLRPTLRRLLQRGTCVYTDSYAIYDFLSEEGYQHDTVNHSAGEYARGQVHVNTTEGIWSLLRPYLAIFRGVSKPYLPLYIATFEFIFNHRHLSSWERAGALCELILAADGPHIRKVVRSNTIVEYCQLPLTE